MINTGFPVRRSFVTGRLPIAGLALCLLISAAGCKKKTPIAAPSARPSVGVPASSPEALRAGVEISASPASVPRGEQVTLSWKASNASSVVIDGGIGNVDLTGSLVISPRESTTFTATAKGAGGDARASTRVTVTAPHDLDRSASSDIDALDLAIREGRVRPIFFAYDKAELTADSTAILEENARWFRRYADAAVIVEGHCDERGSEEYNLALGDRRAVAAHDYLVQLGVDAGQLESISYGEERPFNPGQGEAAWSQNRRAHFSVKR